MKDAYYFSHDCGARNDPKMLQLRISMGWEGYGLFFAFIEVLREQKEYKFPSNAKATLELSFSVGKDVVEKFFRIATDVGLLVDDGDFIYSESLNTRMRMKEKQRERRIEAGRKGGNAKAMAQQRLARKGKERKGKKKESKGKGYTDSFLSFWEKYPNKKAKATAFTAWEKITFENGMFEDIMGGLEKFKSSDDWTRDGGRYIPHPATWLNGKRWEDEYIEEPKQKTLMDGAI